MEKIKASDLMIGNYVKYLAWDEDRGGNIISDPEGDEIVEVTIDILKAIEENRPLEKYEPIPITEKWLDDFGFFAVMGIGPVTNDYVFVIDRYNTFKVLLRLDQNNYNKAFLFVLNEYMQPLLLKYVHQLQSIFKVLTGKQLKKQ